MTEPSLALLQTLIERLIVEQRQVLNRLERIERALLLLNEGFTVRATRIGRG
jgi:hypothetical protein